MPRTLDAVAVLESNGVERQSIRLRDFVSSRHGLRVIHHARHPGTWQETWREKPSSPSFRCLKSASRGRRTPIREAIKRRNVCATRNRKGRTDCITNRWSQDAEPGRGISTLPRAPPPNLERHHECATCAHLCSAARPSASAFIATASSPCTTITRPTRPRAPPPAAAGSTSGTSFVRSVDRSTPLGKLMV